MIVLGIESSCDETAAAIVNDRREILGDCVLTQLEHKIYGGVVPEIAAVPIWNTSTTFWKKLLNAPTSNPLI